MNILALQYPDSGKLSTDVLDVDTGIDWLVYPARYSQQCQAQSHFVVRSRLDIVENTEIMVGPNQSFYRGTLRPDCHPFRAGIFTPITNFSVKMAFGGVSMQHILIVEDDLDIQELLKNFLQEVGYAVTLASDGIEAISLFASTHFDLILLDIMLPMTALNGEEEQIRGLDLQVDDYITKPFSMPILVRKIGAVLRRSSMIPEQEHQTITYKNLVLDMDSYTAVVDGISFDLTQREFEVLRELLLNQGRVLTRQNLLDKLWKYDFYGDERVVDTHIKNLRKKLGIDFIQTIRGVGYKIDKEN